MSQWSVVVLIHSISNEPYHLFKSKVLAVIWLVIFTMVRGFIRYFIQKLIMPFTHIMMWISESLKWVLWRDLIYLFGRCKISLTGYEFSAADRCRLCSSWEEKTCHDHMESWWRESSYLRVLGRLANNVTRFLFLPSLNSLKPVLAISSLCVLLWSLCSQVEDFHLSGNWCRDPAKISFSWRCSLLEFTTSASSWMDISDMIQSCPATSMTLVVLIISWI